MKRWTVLATFSGAAAIAAEIGADKPWTTYEAEAMRTNGRTFGPGYQPHTLETESSNQRYAQLTEVGHYLEFTATADANALIVRFSLPDAEEGGGASSIVSLMIDGSQKRMLELDSRNAWLYGTYPFSNDSRRGKPRNFYDEHRVKGLAIEKGDTVRIQKAAADGVACAIDLVDLERIPEPLVAPKGALSLLDFGARGDGETDDSEALLACLGVAREEGHVVWAPPGDYKLTRDVVLPSDVSIQGAGMWHTTFVGDAKLYDHVDRRVRFKLKGSGIRLSDFAIIGALNYRNDQEPNDGIIGEGCSDSVIERIWIEHTKVGVWIYNGSNITIEGCRFRNMIADGTNFCVGTADSVVENSTARGTGDDCFAIWPAVFDQDELDEHVVPGNNVIRRCTGQLTFLANGAAVYGGRNNRIEDCEFIDIGTGCGILISTTFPTADESRGIDHNFSGVTVIRNNRLVRCGGYDHSWAWRGSLQICMDRKSISGLNISGIEIHDSFSDGVTIVGPGSAKGEGTLSDSSLGSVTVFGVGLGEPESYGLLVREDAMGAVRLRNCALGKVENRSENFRVIRN